MPNFHCIGMKNTEGKGLDRNKNEYVPENYAAALLYLEKAETKVAKMSRERFLKLWDRELIKLGNTGYEKGDKLEEREMMAKAYIAGREGHERSAFTENHAYFDLFERGRRDAEMMRARAAS